MNVTIEERVQAAIARVPGLDHKDLIGTRANAVRFGDAAKPLIAAIDERLAEFDAAGGMAKHRLDFARSMLSIVQRHKGWVASRDLFNWARTEFSDNPYVAYMAENSARQIPLTKALSDVLPEFPAVEYRKEGTGQSDRIYYRHRT